MKLKKYIWLAALPFALTACQDDALVEDPTGRGITTLSCTMEGGLPDSRAQIVFGGTSTTAEYFHWNAGDAFTLYESIEGGSLTEHKFNIHNYDEAAPSANATFKTESQSGLASGNTFVAYYPEVEAGENGVISLSAPVNEISVTEEKNEDAAWKEYFQQSMYMVAQGTVGTSSLDTKLKFEHLCGLIRITYTNETEESVSVENISLNGNWGTGILLSNKSVDATDFEQDSENTQELELILSGVSIDPDESKDFYLLFIPPHGQDVSPMSYINIDGKKTPETYMGKKFSVSGFEAGQSYWFNVTNTGDEETLAWTKELHSEDFVGTLTEQMECANFATLQAALNSEVVKIIILTKDIAMLSPVTVNHPVILDLNGKKLTVGTGYIPDETDAVFNVTATTNQGRVQFVNGDIACAAGNPVQNYLFKLNGNTVNFSLNDIDIKSEGMIPNIIYMDNDNLNINSSEGKGENVKVTNISTTGNVIYSETKESRNIYQSQININGTLTGDFYFKSLDNARNYLNTELTIASAKIKGDLIFDGVAEEYKSKRVKYHYQNVEIGEEYLTVGSWKQAKEYADNQMYEINTLDGLKEYLAKDQIREETTVINFVKTENNVQVPFEITLDAPLLITKPVRLELNGNTLSIPSSGFTWGETNAAITNQKQLIISGGTVKGECSPAASDKYLFNSNGNNTSLIFRDVTLTASYMNAVKVTDSRFGIEDEIQSATNITVGADYYGIYAESTNYPVNINLNMSGKITGKIGYCLKTDMSSSINLNRGTVEGSLVAIEGDGTKKGNLMVTYGQGVDIPQGWPTALDMMKQQFEMTGHYSQKTIEIKENVEFVLDSSFEEIRFYATELTGNGTITFKQKTRSETPQAIVIGVENLSDNVDFVFDGNFKKQIHVGSTQIQKVMNWAEKQDRVELILTGNVTLTETLTSDKLTMVYGSKEAEPGVFRLLLNGHTITSELDDPAIIWKGGVLEIMNGNINTLKDAIQVGAVMTKSTDNGVVVRISATNITSSNGRCVYYSSSETGEQYKKVEVELNANTVLKSGLKAVTMDYVTYEPGDNAILIIQDAEVKE